MSSAVVRGCLDFGRKWVSHASFALLLVALESMGHFMFYL